jgi:AraC-like DNA-binding protein
MTAIGLHAARRRWGLCVPCVANVKSKRQRQCAAMPAAAPAHHCQLLMSPWPGLHAARLHSARHFGRHTHDAFGFGVVEQGAQRSASGRGPVDAYAGDLITTNPGEVHDGRPLGGDSRGWHILYIEPSLLASLRGERAEGLALARPVLHDAALRLALQQLLGRLLAWNARRDSSTALAVEEAFTHAGGTLLLRHGTARAGDEANPGLDAVRDTLAGTPATTPSLAELAALAGASRWQLLRHFRRAYGLSPHEWLLQRRAERARGLIAAGLPLVDAAAAAGFADQSHMTRTFARHWGYSPGAWQRATSG